MANTESNYRASRAGCEAQRDSGTAWTSCTTAQSTSITSIASTSRRCWRSTRASGGCSTFSRRPGWREHPRHLHGRQRLLVRRARPDRQAARLRGIDARADAGLGAGLDRAGGSKVDDRGHEHRHRADDARRWRARNRRTTWTAGACSPCCAASLSRGSEPFLYEYYWECNFPHTPTQFALRGDRYKYIFYHGVWDVNEFYDLQEDPSERFNLINVPHVPEADRPDAIGALRCARTKRRDAGAGPPRQLAGGRTSTAIGRQHDGELVDRGAAAPVPRPTAFRAAPGPLRIPPHFDYGNLMRATTGK